ncbi:unnamed protein product [Rotaria sp. Silwood1]|nr:unnamed protein product [Rotaria sp. Silwood1]CAF1641909.1 unnamed protein product [Rotaria sp. Silwood1]CAF4022375.1 unnamed protein product [Rotaria sp. Silwood1]CAF5042868.1 unnamed protein product [Rotaria sp. Silwood1]
MVAMSYQSHWYRARILEFKSTTNLTWIDLLNKRFLIIKIFHIKIQFIDQGEICKLDTNAKLSLRTRFLDRSSMFIDEFNIESSFDIIKSYSIDEGSQ